MKEFMTFVWILIFGASFIGCTKHPALKIGDCVEEIRLNMYTGYNELEEKIQITNIGFKTYKYKLLKSRDFPNLIGMELEGIVEFDYYDNFKKVNCGELK